MSREELLFLVEKHGVDTVLSEFGKVITTLVEKSQIKRSFGPNNKVVCIGMEDSINPTILEEVIAFLLEVAPDSAEKEELRKTYTYWQGHKDEILADNRIDVS